MKIKLAEDSRAFQLNAEKKLKQELIANLRDDGHGHHHAIFADRLQNFDLRIVPLNGQPQTAAISWDEAIIYINAGFLQTSNRLDQLNVILRHELAHNLMMHHVRMTHYLAKKYGELDWQRKSMSSVLHDLQNIVMDAEISNERYTAEDKHIVRYMTWNYELIGGIVTDDIRSSWTKLSVAEMYDRLMDEANLFKQRVRAGWRADELTGKDDGSTGKDYIRSTIATKYKNYADITSDSIFQNPLEKLISSNKFKQFIPGGQEIILDLYNSLIKNEAIENYSGEDIKHMMQKIADTELEANAEIISPITNEVLTIAYTPEEKFIAIECLKNILDFYVDEERWEARIKDILSDPKYTVADLDKIIAALNN